MICILAYVCLFSNVVAALGSGKQVNVQLRARWRGTPLIFEGLEALAGVSIDVHQQAFHAWTSNKLIGSNFSSCVEYVLHSLLPYAQTAYAPLLQLQLSTRHHTAHLEAIHQIALQTAPEALTASHCCFAVLDGQLLASLKDVTTALRYTSKLDPAQPEVHTPRSTDWLLHRASGDTVDPRSLIVYGAPGSECFRALHSTIQLTVADFHITDVDYAVRPVLFDHCVPEPTDEISSSACLRVGTEGAPALPGYGVALALKNMEYNQVNVDGGNQGSSQEGIDSSMSDAVKGGIRLDLHNVADLGIQAAHSVLMAEDPIARMAVLALRFPEYASELSALPVNGSMRLLFPEEGPSLIPGASFVLINGIYVRIQDALQMTHFLEVLLHDSRLQASLEAAGFHPIDASAVLQARAQDRMGTAAIRIDLRGGATLWLNDLEQDSMYSDWESSLRGFLSSSGMLGMPPAVRRNALNLQIVTEPLSWDALALQALVMRLYMQGFPIRLGALLRLDDELGRFLLRQEADSDTALPDFEDLSEASQFVRLMLAVHKGFGRAAAWQYWYMVGQSALPQPANPYEPDSEPMSGQDVTTTLLIDTFISAWAALQSRAGGGQLGSKGSELGKRSGKDVLALLKKGDVAGIEERIEEHVAFVHEKGLSRLSGAMFAVNGELQPLTGDHSVLMRACSEHLRALQQSIAQGLIPDATQDIYGLFLDQEGWVPRYSPAVLGSTQDSDLEATGRQPQHALDHAVCGQSNERISGIHYLHAPGTRDEVKAVTHWLLFDPVRQPAVLVSALAFLTSGRAADARVAMLFTPGRAVTPLHRALHTLASLRSRADKIPACLLRLAGDAGLWDSLAAGEPGAMGRVVSIAKEAGLNHVALQAALNEDGVAEMAHLLEMMRSMQQLAEALVDEEQLPAVVTNGRVASFTDTVPEPADFEVMSAVAMKLQPGNAVQLIVRAAQESGRTRMPASTSGAGELSSDAVSDMAMIASSIASRPTLPAHTLQHQFSPENLQLSSDRQQVFAQFAGSPRFVTAWSRSESQVGQVWVQICLDPLSEDAQKMAGLWLALRDVLPMRFDLLLNPALNLTSLPLDSFYAYAMPVDLGHTSAAMAPAMAVLPNLPDDLILTLALHVPDAWLVEVSSAPLDTDNLRLADSEGPVLFIEVELEALLLQGRCIDITARGHESYYPRGVQLALGVPGAGAHHDTLVMANLGYFQLQANPGPWSLQLASGRSADMFSILVGSTSRIAGLLKSKESLAPLDRPQLPVFLDSLSGRQETLFLRKREMYFGQDVLQDTGQHDGAVQSNGSEGDIVNIFSIASGHMYERLQKIMMLSVLKHTTARVKFWLIKNYMSPQMRQVLPLMAEEYGFDVEFVTYKWPEWLRGQTEKQRIIWAYKILFLDVLFPLNIKRIIFCDSDQIIRADMAELFHVDMHGKPLAYTPFCDNNKEMEGYRFWKSGYWKGHLRGRPYHISALYVVDLARFREMAAGDQLRVLYSTLSADPNSLSNLDQDLPNYAQHQVPIHSLPQEWLWCESWCGNDTKAAAKTIDLCNNPMTKEPKLHAARRIVAEWSQYDAEVSKFMGNVTERA